MYGPRAKDITKEMLSQLIVGENPRIDVQCAARIFAAVMESRVEVGDASAYIYHFARQQGWDIPAYPLAGCGEIRQFFAEQGVIDIPSWYVKIGVPRERAERLYGDTLVAVRGPEFSRLAFVLDGRYFRQDVGFENLEDSGFIDLYGTGTAGAERLEALLAQMLAFVLRGETGGRPTF
jgi:hypothetical protein